MEKDCSLLNELVILCGTGTLKFINAFVLHLTPLIFFYDSIHLPRSIVCSSGAHRSILMNLAFISPFVPLSKGPGGELLLSKCPRNRLKTRPAATRSKQARLSFQCCVEVPSWKRFSHVDPDFAKDEQLQILETELHDALEREDFSQSSVLRDKLLRLQSGAYVAVLSANMKFYEAMNRRSIVDMAGCWLQSSSVTCKHVNGPLVHGYIDIINSFGYVFTFDLPFIEVQNCRIVMRGSVAYVTLEQKCSPTDGSNQFVIAATSLYTKHNSQWYLTHYSSMVMP